MKLIYSKKAVPKLPASHCELLPDYIHKTAYSAILRIKQLLLFCQLISKQPFNQLF